MSVAKFKTTPTNKHVNALIKLGYKNIPGVDEVGRGCLAGPVVAAAVILPARLKLSGVTDSKLISPSKRRKLAITIKQSALAIGLGWVNAEQIDKYGLTWAVSQAAKRALADMAMSYDAVLLDGSHNYLGNDCFVQTVIRGDSHSLNIASASIIAKVARDNYMHAQHKIYPQYGFNNHVGYGTRQHLAALKYGLSPLHRRLFAPVSIIAAAGGLSVN